MRVPFAYFPSTRLATPNSSEYRLIGLAIDKDEDTVRAELYKRFRWQGPAYYGDTDEADGAVLADDAELEKKGEPDDRVLGLDCDVETHAETSSI